MRPWTLLLPSAIRRRLRRPTAYAICGAILAVTTGVATWRLLDYAAEGAARYGDPVEAAIALRDLPAGSVIDPSTVEIRKLPSAAVPPSAVQTRSTGRALRQAVSEGQVLVTADLGDPGSSGTAAALPPETVAIAVPLGEASLRLERGDRVDLIEIATDDATSLGFAARDAVVVSAEEGVLTVAVNESDASRVAAAVAVGSAVPVLRSAT